MRRYGTIKLRNRHDKRAIEKCLDAINAETINCQESLMAAKFKKHANSMMRDAYRLDSIVHENKDKAAYRTMQQLKNYIKQLQHPIIGLDGEISSETYDEVKYIRYCLGDLMDELNL